MEWNLLLIAALRGAREDPDFVWRPSIDAAGDALAWVLLAGIVLTAPLRHP